MRAPICRACWLGRLDYEEAWRLMQALVGLRADDLSPDTLLLLDHPPTYTIGRRGADGHLLAPREVLADLGASLYEVDRGGGITFHGPGQLVGYPIIRLSPWKPDVHGYVRSLEEVIIRALADYGIVGERWPGFTGVWVGNDKIAAIGVKVSRWVTSHGFALNVNVDLEWFRHIVPCGISDKGVASVQQLLGRDVSLEEMGERLLHHFGEVFQREISVCTLKKGEELICLGQ